MVKKPSLVEGDVHVWRAFLDWSTDKIEKEVMILSPEEKARADRFVYPEHRERYITSHAILHSILTLYSPELTSPLRFRYSDHGKPYLVDNPSLQFNLSDSRDIALYAITLNREVGIDIEYMRNNIHVEGIAQRFFSPEESAALQTLPSNERLEAFYRIWTLKEAYIKVIGQGLSFPLDRFTTNPSAAGKDGLLTVDGDAERAKRWSLCSIPSTEGYMAALAAEGPINRILYFSPNVG